MSSPNPSNGETTVTAAPAAAKGKKAVGKRRKEKKAVIDLSLYVNGCKYEYNLLCTFCTKLRAVVHCPECTDFYCSSCDTTAHNTKKRKHHIRTKLSHLDMDTAGGLITRAVRRYGHIRALQARCRVLYKRLFDRASLSYYYYNSVYGTVSWRKPYCLRKLELAPYMPADYAASKCQNLYHLWRARLAARQRLDASYAKVFDRKAGRFYYAFHGKSLLLPRSSWRKPRFLGKRSFPRDLRPVYTPDVAALIIQRKWRAILIKQLFRALVRASYDEVWDPIKGRCNYYHRDTAVLHADKPSLLGSEPWDPHRVSDWSIERVALFLRRIGLRQYVEKMSSYGVDGNALVLLDDEDYDNLGIVNRLHIRKIRVEIERIFSKQAQRKVVMSGDHELRREKIRRQKMFHAAATKLQAQFRRFAAQKEVAMLWEMRRINIIEQHRAKRILASSMWWSENKSLPSKKLTVLPSIGSNGAKLPPIKAFGRSRDHLSQRGWGRRAETLQAYQSVHSAGHSSSAYVRFLHAQQLPYEHLVGSPAKGVLQGPSRWIPTAAAQIDPQFQGESSPSLIFSEKLFRSGYDAKRMHTFMQHEQGGT